MKRLLLIDPSESYREGWGSYFRDRGFDVVTATCGADGLERWRDSGPFDVSVVDLYLPGQDGMATMETIAEMTNAPVVAVAERRATGIDLLPAARVLGAARSYRKPIPTDVFWREICELVDEGQEPERAEQVVGLRPMVQHSA